ncbi:tRNA lysidine(34) synthetase TilS [Exiguobacterium aestuarii]|uniref:tRNA(Ile)-lysidine synthase n=1 Tax=Exiguobacterium aestuarii TaxID=273527 RepID=A0ABW2PSZ4_9BACL|nr:MULTISPECIES: tRNA lysidine(34) synthetase TilS [Exiguobacterium]MCT4787038.1 tRNA lysidine(34) synthetase TilS [Exiguobacterium aestuarii]
MKKVLVAVSGGVDSIVLLDRLVKRGWDVAVAHVHHGLREASDEEYTFVTRVAETYHVPFHGTRLHFQEGGSQARYREARYRFFEDIMNKYGYDTLATAHHADDELETVLIQLHRNVIEVKGIPETRQFGNGTLIRPLLQESKAQLIEYAQQNGLDWREDATNQERTYLRNRIRHEIVPRLKQMWPSIVEEVSKVAKQARADWDARYESCEQWIEAYVALEMKAFHVKLEDFGRLPCLERYTVGRLLSSRYELNVSEAMEKLLQSQKDTGTYHLTGEWFMTKRNGVLNLVQRSVPDSLHPVQIDSLPTVVQFGGRTISLSVEEGREGIPLHEITYPLVIRSIAPGDRMRLAVGTKKVARILIDEKIERMVRPTLPLLEDASGRILAIVGVRVSEFLDKSDAICLRLMVK